MPKTDNMELKEVTNYIEDIVSTDYSSQEEFKKILEKQKEWEQKKEAAQNLNTLKETKQKFKQNIELETLINGSKPVSKEEKELALKNEKAAKKRQEIFEQKRQAKKDKEKEKRWEKWKKSRKKGKVEVANFRFHRASETSMALEKSSEENVNYSKIHTFKQETEIIKSSITQDIEMKLLDNVTVPEPVHEKFEELLVNTFITSSTNSTKVEEYSIEMKDLNNKLTLDKEQEAVTDFCIN